MGQTDCRLTSIQINGRSCNLVYPGKNNLSCVCAMVNFKLADRAQGRELAVSADRSLKSLAPRAVAAKKSTLGSPGGMLRRRQRTSSRCRIDLGVPLSCSSGERRGRAELEEE